MAKQCSDCIYGDSSSGNLLCRFNAPAPSQSNATQTFPIVNGSDWCSKGWNETDGFYDPMPMRR